jgi:hypothetical protein
LRVLVAFGGTGRDRGAAADVPKANSSFHGFGGFCGAVGAAAGEAVEEPNVDVAMRSKSRMNDVRRPWSSSFFCETSQHELTVDVDAMVEDARESGVATGVVSTSIGTSGVRGGDGNRMGGGGIAPMLMGGRKEGVVMYAGL